MRQFGTKIETFLERGRGWFPKVIPKDIFSKLSVNKEA